MHALVITSSAFHGFLFKPSQNAAAWVKATIKLDEFSFLMRSDLWLHCPQLSDLKSNRRDSAHAVCWVHLHHHCFLHPLHFGAATHQWVMWLFIVEYQAVDVSLSYIHMASGLVFFDPWVRSSVNSVMVEHAVLAGRNGLTSPLLQVLIIKVHTGINLKCKCCKQQTGVCGPLLFH